MANAIKQLQNGQKVGLQEREYGYQLTLLTGDQPGHVVVEVDPEFVVLEDAAAGVKKRIPVFLISAVTAAAPETTTTTAA
jgi:hypothetical protein